MPLSWHHAAHGATPEVRACTWLALTATTLECCLSDGKLPGSWQSHVRQQRESFEATCGVICGDLHVRQLGGHVRHMTERFEARYGVMWGKLQVLSGS